MMNLNLYTYCTGRGKFQKSRFNRAVTVVAQKIKLVYRVDEPNSDEKPISRHRVRESVEFAN